MSKYKAGDKVVYEVKEIIRDGVCLLSGWKESEPLSTYTEPLEAKIRRQAAEITRLLGENMRLKLNYENIRAKGQNEAWKLARKIVLPQSLGGMNDGDYREIFGSGLSEKYVMSNYTYHEAAAKVAEWENVKEENTVQNAEGN